MKKFHSILSAFRCAPRHFQSFKECGVKNLQKNVIVITGCDSGLGYSLSLKCNELGFTVVSGCLDMKSDGASALSSKTYTFPLDVRSSDSVKQLVKNVNGIIEKENCNLYAIVNNAGVMIFGEFEWLTERQIMEHVNVNVLGCFRIAKAFLPLLRKYKGRIINVTSHCSLANLPTLSVYGATKAAIQSWSDGLRVEQRKYGVKVINFIPGSLATQSKIMHRQKENAMEMKESFTEEQESFYLNYFEKLNSYLLSINRDNTPLEAIKDEKLYEKFVESLLHPNPKACYKNEPIRYFIYYNLFNITPTCVRDNLVKKFMKLPSYNNSK